MTVATTLITLALTTSGVTGDGQVATTLAIDTGFALLNDSISQWQIERTVKVISGTLEAFPDLTTDQPFWTPYENLLLTTLAVRLRSAYFLEPDKTMDMLAASAVALFQANNQQQVAPLHAGVPTTCIQLIFLALRMAGRITDEQSVSDGSKDVNDAFALMVMIVAQWRRKRWLNTGLIDVSFVTTGAQSYSLGTGGDVNTPRPDRLEAVFLRLLQTAPQYSSNIVLDGSGNAVTDGSGNPVLDGSPITEIVPSVGTDCPLYLIQGREEYNRITLKAMSAWPRAAFYDAAYPLGNLFVWPVPVAGVFEIHCTLKAGLPVYATVNDLINLPDEYYAAMLYSLAVQIAMLNGADPKPSHVSAMRAALNTIRLANTQIPAARMPAGLSHRTRGRGSDMAGFISGWTT